MSAVVMLILQIAVILIAARAAGVAVRYMGQPSVIGEMIAGVLLGPSFFGWLAPGAFVALFTVRTMPALDALSQIGLVFFMFLLGLRFGLDHLRAGRRVALATSAVSIAVPFTLGSVLALRIYERLAPAGISQLAFVLFIGTAMSITAFPVLARILMEKHLFATDLGGVAIACAAADDVAGWMILGGVMALVGGGDARAVMFRLVLLAGYLLVMIVVVRPALSWLRHRRGSNYGNPVDLLVFTVVMAVSAMTTNQLGIHALFGAFFAGLIAPRDARVEGRFAAWAEPAIMTLLVPLFFALTGLRTNLQLLDTWPMWRDASVILTVAIVGKGGASMLAARASGIGWRQAIALGALLNTRGLIELVVLNIGLQFGILSPAVFSMLVLMALVTTFMTSPLVAWILPAAASSYHKIRVVTHT